MPKPPTNQDSKAILEILNTESEGLQIKEIEQRLTSPISRRTLLRRLTELKKANYLVTEGSRTNLRYLVKNKESIIAFSTEAENAINYVRQPLAKRKPVAYQKDFLYGYEPNKTEYLSTAIKKHLAKQNPNITSKLDANTFSKRILNRLLIDLSWNSSRLEGNTYSLLETERLIEYGALAEEKTAFEAQMIINHKDAIEFMVEYIDEPLDSRILFNIHALLSNNLIANPRARGQLRQIPVQIGRSAYHPPEIPALIQECFSYLVKTASAIKDPFEQAFFLMVQIPYLQAFEDINKRVSRLALNIPLLKNGLAPLCFVDVPATDYIAGLLSVYELNNISLIRDVFLWAYEHSSHQYAVVQETLGQANITQLKFKHELKTLINLIIDSNQQGPEVIKTIETWSATHIPKKFVKEFAHIAEREIAGLHEGNIAIYKIAPEAFSHWRKNNL